MANLFEQSQVYRWCAACREAIRARTTQGLFAGTAALPSAVHSKLPMTYMAAHGTKNYPVVSLLWGLIGISAAVVVIVTALLLIGMIKHWRRPHSNIAREVPPTRSGRGLGAIYIGSALSIAALFGAAIWTFQVLAQISNPPGNTPFTVTVIGHQWWWEARYESPDASRDFTTANEIHIPVGKPIRIKLSTGDVIHSFWVPQLSGKMDTIPGQNNITWLEADTPGAYRGQCTEYCGLQHAQMALFVFADPPDKFQSWWDDQLKAPPQPSSQLVSAGQGAFMTHCAVCHAVRGTLADGKTGPDLSHLMTRTTIASGTLPNTIGYLSGWISDPQRIKPGNYMPTLDLSAPDLDSIRAYLETLH